jgi:hypothetical protein
MRGTRLPPPDLSGEAMSKGPTPRHSKSPKPLTIDLDATDVTPRSAPDADTKPTPDKPAADQAAAKAVETGAGGRPAEKAPERTPASGSGGTAKAATGEAMPSETKTEAPAGKKTDASGDKPAAAGADIKTDSKTGESASSGRAGGSASAMPGAESKTAASQSKPSEPKPVQPAPSKRGGGFGMVVSGLIGAIIALGGGYGLQTAGLLPVPGGSPSPVKSSPWPPVWTVWQARLINCRAICLPCLQAARQIWPPNFRRVWQASRPQLPEGPEMRR